MTKIGQCGAGLHVNFKVSKKRLGKTPSLSVRNAVQGLHGAGFMSNIIPMVLRVAKPVGAAIGRAAMSAAKALVKKGAEKAGEKVGEWGTDLITSQLSTSSQRQGPEFDRVDMGLFPNVPQGDPRMAVHGLFPPQSGQGVRLAGCSVQLAGTGKRAALNYPRRFVIKRR